MAGYRFGQTAQTAMATQGQYLGSEGQSFASGQMNMRGRGATDTYNRTFGVEGQKFYAGQGGVETYPGCYGLPTYCGWQQVAGSNVIEPGNNGVVSVLPTVSPYFEPKAVYLFGIDRNAPGTNLRFTVGAITVGGAPQLAINTLAPIGIGSELLSDVFNRSDEPLLVNWSVFSTTGLARELQINVFNLNLNNELLVFACVWGNAVSSLDCYA